ncbi:MAG TPA: phosphate-starvation-inducible PsiE family protein [Actinomycetota bacterium]|nr:phosphate-starvation-inducible PsiE family protein [Actinomycetota bacterium]
MAKSDDGKPEPFAQPFDRLFRVSENGVYAAIGLVLVLGALLGLGTVAYHLVLDLKEGTESALRNALDGLLLVFIILELLAGVRATMTERQLVAEPFLIVGIIASIKEIVVITLEAKETRGQGGVAFQNAMIEVGVLGGVVLLLALAGFLVRRKEREPEEADQEA